MKGLLLLIGITIPVAVLAGDNDWWTHGVFYQIYPRSFKDNDNDGIGDLQGIISRMKHLKDLGVSATWLSPIYKSPQVDQGYDISDFRAIAPEYGTMNDIDELIKVAKELGIRLIMDFVPNHTSNLHEWFIKSENNEEGYEDFYVWKEGANNNTQPPNNWISAFGGSAWEYSPKRNLWYLHEFAIQQPDLNYRSPRVVQEMKDVLTFWLDRGVAGFRVDAIPFLFEDLSFANESVSDLGSRPDEHGYLIHNLTMNLNETYDMVYQWRALLDEYEKTHPEGGSKFMTTEAYADVEHTMLYYGNGTRKGSHFTFNFYLIEDLKNGNPTADDVVKAIRKFSDNLPKEYTPNWVLGNHDNHRVATRLGVENADGYNMLSLLLPGTAVSYNGDEIGQEDGEVSYEEGKDPSACKFPDRFNQLSRDFERTPFQWDNSTNAGFNKGAKPWLPVSKKYNVTNLLAQKEAERSHYKVYKALVQLRKRREFANGDYAIRALNPDVILLLRHSRSRSYYVLVNIGNAKHHISFPEHRKQLRVVLASTNSRKNPGDVMSSKNITLDPHESFVAASYRRY